ncbi:MAG: hypothetical protein GXY52_00175 [Chloroflexi bacterium]|nr:hypothetical protein [Chloroflexota bacterium]
MINAPTASKIAMTIGTVQPHGRHPPPVVRERPERLSAPVPPLRPPITGRRMRRSCGDGDPPPEVDLLRPLLERFEKSPPLTRFELPDETGLDAADDEVLPPLDPPNLLFDDIDTPRMTPLLII